MRLAPPLTLAVFISTLFVLLGTSCTQEKESFRLILKHDPVGKVVTYKLASQRNGSMFQDNEFVRNLDRVSDGKITYTTQKVLPDGAAIVHEYDIWSWDAPADDSGQIKRITREYNYRFHVAANGKIFSYDVLDDTGTSMATYMQSYADQATPIFPDEPVSPGHSWSQTNVVDLPDSEETTVTMVYTVKGTGQKKGYTCAIIEYRGNMALPLFDYPMDSITVSGVDRIEVNGLMYIALEPGVMINSEERQRVVAERNYVENGQPHQRRYELETTISLILVSIDGG